MPVWAMHLVDVEFCFLLGRSPYETGPRHKAKNLLLENPGPGCSKLTTSLNVVSLKFQTLISEIC